jgi:NitT/TauT family transport system substrate-binding protein
VRNISRSRIIAAGAAFAAAPSAARAQALDKLRLSAVPTDDMTPVYWGLKSGVFRKAGIDLEVIVVSSGSASTAAVVSGAYDMGKASPIASLLAHLRGLPITIVANGAMYQAKDQWSGVLVTTDSPIKTAADCNGKTACIAGLNDIHQLAMMAWIDKNGGDSKTIKWVEVPGSATAPALIEKRVEFSMLDEPLLGAALETGKIKKIGDAYATISTRWLTSAFLVQPDYAAKHADLVKRFAKALYEAAAYTNTHETETAPMMSEVTKIPPAVYGKMGRIEGSTSGDQRLLTPLIDAAFRYKIIPRSFPASELYWSG